MIQSEKPVNGPISKSQSFADRSTQDHCREVKGKMVVRSPANEVVTTLPARVPVGKRHSDDCRTQEWIPCAKSPSTPSVSDAPRVPNNSFASVWPMSLAPRTLKSLTPTTDPVSITPGLHEVQRAKPIAHP